MIKHCTAMETVTFTDKKKIAYNYSDSGGTLEKLNPGGAGTWIFLGGCVPPGTPNWHPVLKKISPKIDTPF